MKRFNLIILFSIISIDLFAQADSITHRDDKYLNKSVIPDLFKTYESYLNVISDNNTEQPERKELMDRMVGAQKNKERIFFDEKVIIESDITPGADTMKTPEDKSVLNYLGDFNSFYAKSNESTVEISVKKISTLKKASYLYYNVLFDCTFHGTNTSTKKSYSTVKRVAEIRILSDSSWYAYISSIRFAKPDFNIDDTLNQFTAFSPSIFDGLSDDEYYSKLIDNKKKQKGEEETQILEYIAKGDSAYDKADLETAKSMYSQAWIKNPQYKLTIEAREKVNKAIEKKDKEKKEKEYKASRIEELKLLAKEYYAAYDFGLTAQIYDSLIQNYGVRGDTAIENKKTEVAYINSIAGAINNAISDRRYDDAIDRCKISIKDPKNKSLEIECHYLMALAYYHKDSTGYSSRIFENLKFAIDNSNNKHSRALVLRAKMYKVEHKFDDAIKDAGLLISLHSREPQYYALRASVYEANNKKESAIGDYANAIIFNTKDSTVYIKKASLELETGNFQQALKSTSDVIVKTPCYADAFYYRALANEKISDFSASGKDYFRAVLCGLSRNKQEKFIAIADDHFYKGKKSCEMRDTIGSKSEFSNAILLDSNNNAFYFRALAYLSMHKIDSAEADLSTLIKRDNKYPEAFYRRGLIRRDKMLYEDAYNDFRNERANHPDTISAYLEMSKIKSMQEKYADAGNDAKAAAIKFKDDYAYDLAAEAYYRAMMLDSAISMANHAEQIKTQRSHIFYIRGRAYYDQGKYDEAMSDFKEVLKLQADYVQADYWRGLILMKRKKYSDADESFAKAFSNADLKAKAYFYSGKCKIKLGEAQNMKDAVNNFSKAVDSDPKDFQNAETYSLIAYAQMRGNARNPVIGGNLSKAKSLDSTNVIFYFVSACDAANNNSFVDAMNLFEKAYSSKSFRTNDMGDEKENFYDLIKKDRPSKERYKKIVE